MTILKGTNYVPPAGDQPFTHARILHSGNWLSGGSVVASSTAPGFFAAGPNNSLTYEKWKPNSLSATWEYNHGTNATIDCCAVAAHNMFSSQVLVTPQYWTGSTWGSASSSAPTSYFILNNAPALFIFLPRTSSRFRLLFSSTGAATPPTIGVIKFGKLMQMERPLYGGHSPIDLTRRTVTRSNISETGEFLGRSKYRNYLETSFAWRNLSAPWVQANWPGFQRAIETEPFFIAWRPATYQDVGYVQALGPAIPSNSGTRNLMDVEMNVRGLAYD